MAGRTGLGRRIRAARINAGLSQEALASHLGFTKQIVACWEAETRTPPLNTLLAIAEIMMVNPGELLNDIWPDDGKHRVTVSERDEHQLLRLYRKLKPRARHNLLELLAIYDDVTREIEHQHEPAGP